MHTWTEFLKRSAALLLFLQQCLCAAEAAKFRVVQVNEYCRHGARTTWNDNMHLNITQMYGTGALTPNGLRMHYHLGAQIRKNYSHLLGPESGVAAKDFEVWASGLSRTQLSAASQLMGLFPEGLNVSTPDSPELFEAPLEGVEYEWKQEESWALPFRLGLVPINVPSQDFDFLFFANFKATCPKAAQATDQLILQIFQKYQYLVEDFSHDLEKNGFYSRQLYRSPKWNVNNTGLLSDEMIAFHNYHGFHYKGFNKYLMEKVRGIQNIKFTAELHDEKGTRMMADGVARGILKGMDDFVANSSDRKVFRLFAGHDAGTHAHVILTGLTSLECLLKKAEGKSSVPPCEDIPEFGAQFIYELAESEGQYYVRSLYNGKVFSICEGKPEYCPFEQFKKTFKMKMTLEEDEFHELCGNQYMQNKKDNILKKRIEYFWIWASSLIGLVLVVSMLILVIIKATNKRSRLNVDICSSFGVHEGTTVTAYTYMKRRLSQAE